MSARQQLTLIQQLARRLQHLTAIRQQERPLQTGYSPAGRGGPEQPTRANRSRLGSQVIHQGAVGIATAKDVCVCLAI
jgi:hypothetical protein